MKSKRASNSVLWAALAAAVLFAVVSLVSSAYAKYRSSATIEETITLQSSANVTYIGTNGVALKTVPWVEGATALDLQTLQPSVARAPRAGVETATDNVETVEYDGWSKSIDGALDYPFGATIPATEFDEDTTVLTLYLHKKVDFTTPSPSPSASAEPSPAAPGVVPNEIPSPSVSPTATPEPTNAPTPAPSATAVPEPTVTPEATPTPTVNQADPPASASAETTEEEPVTVTDTEGPAEHPAA